MLVLAPVMCILSGIGISAILVTYMKNIETSENQKADKKLKRGEDNYPKKSEIATIMVFFMAFILANYVFHCTWVTSSAYSSPSIVLSATSGKGEKIIFDDFREAYYWMKQNSHEDAKIMSWWDYGYQITAMAN